MHFHTNIARAAAENENYRRVLFAGTKSQVVLMCIPPGGEIGEERHDRVEQTLCFQSGEGEAILDAKIFPVGAGDIVVVTPGVRHNFKNTGAKPLKLFTVYAPPNHIDGRVHKTKVDADADKEDEAFGQAQK